MANSREVNNALVLASGALFVGVLAPGLAARLAEALRPFIERPHAFSLDAATLGMTLQALLAALGWAVLPAVLLFLVAALASGLVQHGPIWSVAPLAPKLERISPVAGAKRLFALRSLVEFAKGVVKIVLVGAAAVVGCGRPRRASSGRPGSRRGRSSRCCTRSRSASWWASPR